MWKNKPPFRVVLNKAVSDDIARQCKHYTRRGVINFVSLVLKLVWVVYHLDSLCQPCFSGLLGFSAPVSLTPAPAAVSMAPAPMVEYGCGRVHNARACRVRDTSCGGDHSASVSGRTSRQCLPCHTRHLSAYLEDRGINRSPLSGFLEMAQNPNGGPYPAYPSDKSWNGALAFYMAQGTLPELTVQQIISCDKFDEGCQGETCQQPSVICGTLQVESTVTQIIPRCLTSGTGLGTVSGMGTKWPQ